VFVPAAEESQDIISFGRWVLRRACRQASEWQRHYGEPAASFGVAVNVSVSQLRDPDLLDDVRAALDDAGWHASALTLEVTESQLIADGDDVVEVLQRLRALGCLVAIDDFGTGYSSLSYLERLPADVLKIDRSFVQRIATSREAQVLVEGIVSMARGLGMDLIAEGVEHHEQAAILRDLGVGLAQGFLWARPLPPAQIEDRMRAGDHRHNRQETLSLDGA
jgi:EAL domain-containing protein (putative c-di-GMP-specific phosphodiesterase class I)